MRNLNIALRSLFKKERHNMTKILSLSVGLAVALILIAKICFERSFDSFYPDVERVYRLVEHGSKNGGDPFESSQTPGAVAPAMKEEVPGIEAATRLTYVTGEGTRITAGDKRRYSADNVLMADSCLFDASRSVGRSEKGARPSGLCDDIAFAGREARGDRPGRRRSPRAG